VHDPASPAGLDETPHDVRVDIRKPVTNLAAELDVSRSSMLKALLPEVPGSSAQELGGFCRRQ
jgi:hypothetical protein